jgi:hypothetical protein
MLGAVETLEAEIGEDTAAYEWFAFSEGVTSVADRAEEPVIAAAWAAGRTMSETEAAAYALATVAKQSPRRVAVNDGNADGQ